MSDHLERLQKVIAHSGVTSRRKAEDLIVAGRVKVNNKVITKLGTRVGPNDDIEVDGIPLHKEKHVYFLLNKPRGVISSVSDDKGRKVVTDFFPHIMKRIYPIGRLDYDSSGLLLLTNDGEFAHLLMHPKHEISKTYVIKVKGIPKSQDLKKIESGVRDGKDLLKASKAKLLSTNRQKNTAILEIILHEGKNRHIRRMMDGVNFPVQKIRRERLGIIHLNNLPAGQYRELTNKEIHELRELAQK